jgi:hypothetical protein
LVKQARLIAVAGRPLLRAGLAGRLLALDLQVAIARRVMRKREQIRPHAAIQYLREQPDAG